MDRIDSRILEELQNDARVSNKELAARVGLAPSSCLERVRRLTEAGVLRGYHADINHAALGVTLQAMVSIQLRHHGRAAVDAFRERVMGLEGVIGAYYLAGATDFLVHVAVRDTRHLRELALEGLSGGDDVAHVETSLIFDHTRRWTLPNYVADTSEAT